MTKVRNPRTKTGTDPTIRKALTSQGEAKAMMSEGGGVGGRTQALDDQGFEQRLPSDQAVGLAVTPPYNVSEILGLHNYEPDLPALEPSGEDLGLRQDYISSPLGQGTGHKRRSGTQRQSRANGYRTRRSGRSGVVVEDGATCGITDLGVCSERRLPYVVPQDDDFPTPLISGKSSLTEGAK